MMTEISLNTYFGIELRSEERPRTVVYVVCKTAHEVGTLFRRLEVLDTIAFGGRNFLRCRTDLADPFPVLELLLKLGRGTIASQRDRGYVVSLADGRVGLVPNMTMHVNPKPGQRVIWRGPAVALWERQFE